MFQKLKAFKLLVSIGVIGHWLACTWFYVGTMENSGWVVDYAHNKYPGEANGTANVQVVPMAERCGPHKSAWASLFG